MTIIENIRLLKGAAVLAERKAVTPSLDLRRFNLFYGFNGSGKSTLSRTFAALQHGKKQDRLPEGCTFEIEMSDGTKFGYPKALTGLEKRVCVFNNDFIAENFRWETGMANPVFYIGADQAEAADQLKALEATFPTAQTKHEGEAKVFREREKAFNEFKRLLARTVSERLRQAARYEAPQFVADVDKLGASADDKLSDADLDAATATCARSEPPAKVKLVEVPVSSLLELIEAAVELAPKSVGSIVVEGLDVHPQMVPWVKQGHEYHVGHDLKSCLYCGKAITDERKKLLTEAFDDNFSKFITELNTAAHHAGDCVETLAIAKAAIPAAAQLSAEFQPPFETAASAFTAALDNVSPLLVTALKAFRERKGAPTSPVTMALPPAEEVRARIKLLDESCNAVNAICKQHADMVDGFNEHQKKAREAIRQHFVATSADDYAKHVSEISDATAKQVAAKAAVEKLEGDIVALRAKVQQHGAAADKINALVKSYLGHGELTIVAVAEGYELPHNGNLSDKLKTLCGRHNDLDRDRLNALERLSQVESHSDSLDDLIAQSSVTVEESRDANAALVHLMEVVDLAHLTDLRKYCKP
ncbi:AAA family ATPase [Bradyrhizobium sp. Ash2021]|uniref:AAA family ATPase n=1 Tax=Bradyrhizobium sp. Ash2021 TaxID=2954771 RepID=UPI002815C98D|nr:AAA family ATPase [Bradyrhizobium sp. Ash2021]WMT76061.1 AAA family ATPase [Bradyrhizobium sp. Ash2021]